LTLDGGVLECTQEAGDVMFVPHSWGHAVVNLVETVGVAGEVATGNILNGGKHPEGDPGQFRPPPGKSSSSRAGAAGAGAAAQAGAPGTSSRVGAAGAAAEAGPPSGGSGASKDEL
jgi:hypothetical protein